MKKLHKLSALALAIAGIATTNVAHALNPWTDGAPDFTIYTSGGAAQDIAYQEAVFEALSVPGSVDVFQDVLTGSSNGSRFTAYYFTGASTLTDPALRGKKILLEKRSLGAAGYGVVPLIANINLDHLDIFHSATSQLLATWTNTTVNSNIGGTTYAVPFHAASITNANAATFLTSTKSHGGFAGVDAAALLKPGTENYPDPIKEVSTNAATAGWVSGYKAKDLTPLTRIPTGGLIYGVAVTLDLYKVLQAAQKASGTLPASTVIGAYDQASLPTLSRNFLAAILAGNIQHWSNVEVNVSGTRTPLNDASFLLAAGGGTTPLAAPTNDKVAVGRRNTGAAVGAVAYAKLLNYPYAESSVPPAQAVPNTTTDETNSAPIVKSPGGASGTESLLVDWQAGSNTSGLNNVPNAKYWGIAIASADKNATVTAAGTGGKAYRYVKIDGFAPTIENVASGNYPYWAEGEVLVNPTVGTSHEVSLFTDFAHALSTNAVAAKVDTGLVQPWGQTGVFATTVTDQNSAIDVPFSASHPIVPFTHLGGDGFTHLGIVPYVSDNFIAGPTGAGATGAFIELQ